MASRRGAWRTLHVVDVENLLGADHRQAGVTDVIEVLGQYEALVGVRPSDLMFYGVNPNLFLTVHQATRRGTLCGQSGTDGADRALLDQVRADWVVGRFDRVCIASGDHAFAPLAADLRAAGVHVTGVSRPMSIHHELYRSLTEHHTLDQPVVELVAA